MEGKPQVYGTQFSRNPDKTIAFKDIENLEKFTIIAIHRVTGIHIYVIDVNFSEQTMAG
jgi:hypothetical protein